MLDPCVEPSQQEQLLHWFVREGRSAQAGIWCLHLATQLEGKLFNKLAKQQDEITEEMTLDEIQELFDKGEQYI